MIRTKYFARSEVDDNNIRAEFDNAVDAIAYASGFSELDKTYVDEVLAEVDEDGQIIKELERETIWTWKDIPQDADAFGVNDWPDVGIKDEEEMKLDTDFDVKDIHEELEAREDLVECQNCFDLFPKEECTKIEYGYLCPHCHSLVIKKIELPGELVDADATFGLEFPEPHKFDDDGDEDEEYTEIPTETEEPKLLSADETPEEPVAIETPVEENPEVSIETPVAFADIPVTVEGSGLEDGSSDDSSDEIIEEPIEEEIVNVDKKPGDGTITRLKQRYPEAILITGDKVTKEFVDNLTRDSVVIIDGAEKIAPAQGIITRLMDLDCKVFAVRQVLKEHVQDRPAPVEDTTVLHGVDNAVVKCKKYTLAAHCEDEKPVDCKLEKPALEKPLAGEKVDVKLYESAESELVAFAASLPDAVEEGLEEDLDDDKLIAFAQALPEDLNESTLEEGPVGDFFKGVGNKIKSAKPIQNIRAGKNENKFANDTFKKGFIVKARTEDGGEAKELNFKTFEDAEKYAKKWPKVSGNGVATVIGQKENGNKEVLRSFSKDKIEIDNLKTLSLENTKEKDTKEKDTLAQNKIDRAESKSKQALAAAEKAAGINKEEKPTENKEAQTDAQKTEEKPEDIEAKMAQKVYDATKSTANEPVEPAPAKKDMAKQNEAKAQYRKIEKALSILGVDKSILRDGNKVTQKFKDLRKALFTESYADTPFDSNVKVGDKIKIIHLEGENNDYDGREGTVDHIDSIGQLHGSWGGLAVIPGVDEFEIITNESLTEDIYDDTEKALDDWYETDWDNLTEAKKDEEEVISPEEAKLEAHTMLNSLVGDEIEAIDGYEASKAELLDKPIEHKEEIIHTINHIEAEEKEHIDELINATRKIPFEHSAKVESPIAVENLNEDATSWWSSLSTKDLLDHKKSTEKSIKRIETSGDQSDLAKAILIGGKQDLEHIEAELARRSPEEIQKLIDNESNTLDFDDEGNPPRPSWAVVVNEAEGYFFKTEEEARKFFDSLETIDDVEEYWDNPVELQKLGATAEEDELIATKELKENLKEASSAETKAFKNGGKDLDDLIQGRAIARIKDPAARDAAVAAVKAGRPEIAKEFTGDRKEDQAAINYEKKAKAMADAGVTDEGLEEDLHKNEEAIIAEWAKEDVDRGLILDENDYDTFVEDCENNGIKPTEDLFKHYFDCVDDLLVDHNQFESLEGTVDQDLEDNRAPEWPEEPELGEPLDGSEMRKHEKAIEETLTESPDVDYVEYMHSYCNALEPHMDELRKINDVEDLKKAILDIVNKDPDVNVTEKKNKFVWLIKNKNWGSAASIMKYLEMAMNKAKNIEVKVDDKGELVKEDLEDEETEICAWCGEEYPVSDLHKEVDLGYLCHDCEQAIKSRGEKLKFED